MPAGSHRRSIRREVRSIERGLREFQREVGDTVVWFEFDPATTTESDTYGEGPIPDPFLATATWKDIASPWTAIGATTTWEELAGSQPAPAPSGLNFKAPVKLPAVWVRYDAPRQVQTEAGLYTITRTSLRLSTDSMRAAGLLNPQDPVLHFSDRYAYKGILYRVESYEPRGWLGGAYLMIDVAGRELKEEELEADSFPFNQAVGTSTPWTPGQQLNWPATQATDWENR